MKKMRMLSMVLALLLTASLSLAVFAAGPAKITVEKQTEDVNAGNEVTLAVTISDNPGFMSGSWNIEYDSSKLELKSINTKLDGRQYMDGLYTPNVAQNTITYANTEAVEGDRTLFTLTFLVKENAASGETVVTVSTKELFTKGSSGKVSIANVPVAGGVTVAGSTTSGSTTGGSTTGGSTTGGSTTGGSTTGGSTTGGSTTGGSTTGGSTTGGSTTGGSTTGGSTTGGSTTGGSTTGGGETESIVIDNKTPSAAPASTIYDSEDKTLTVTCEKPCVVMIQAADGTLTRLIGTRNSDNTYIFDVSGLPKDAKVVVATKGDFDLNGKLTALDLAKCAAAITDETQLTALQLILIDYNGDGKVSALDLAKFSAAMTDENLQWD